MRLFMFSRNMGTLMLYRPSLEVTSNVPDMEPAELVSAPSNAFQAFSTSTCSTEKLSKTAKLRQRGSHGCKLLDQEP